MRFVDFCVITARASSVMRTLFNVIGNFRETVLGGFFVVSMRKRTHDRSKSVKGSAAAAAAGPFSAGLVSCPAAGELANNVAAPTASPPCEALTKTWRRERLRSLESFIEITPVGW